MAGNINYLTLDNVASFAASDVRNLWYPIADVVSVVKFAFPKANILPVANVTKLARSVINGKVAQESCISKVRDLKNNFTFMNIFQFVLGGVDLASALSEMKIVSLSRLHDRRLDIISGICHAVLSLGDAIKYASKYHYYRTDSLDENRLPKAQIALRNVIANIALAALYSLVALSAYYCVTFAPLSIETLSLSSTAAFFVMHCLEKHYGIKANEI